MEPIVEKALLFDFYGELLTQHQKEVYGEYIQDDLSVSEIGALHGISRQGAHDLIRRCEKLLADYEDRLHLVEHFLKIRRMVGEIRQIAGEITDGLADGTDGPTREKDCGEIRRKVEEIAGISGRILEQC